MVEFCQTHSIPHEVCGKVVVATSSDEVTRLKALFQRGSENGLRGLRLLSSEGLREIEPHAAGLAAIHVPEEGIADYARVCEVLTAQIRGRGGEVMTGARVTAIVRGSGGWRVEHSAGENACDWIITCAGLYYRWKWPRSRGKFGRRALCLFAANIICCGRSGNFWFTTLFIRYPDPRLPFLEKPHFTRMMRGGIEAGPNAVLAFAREGYTKSTVSLRDMIDALAFPGLWRFLRRYPGPCWNELRRSPSRELFCRSLQRLVPEIQLNDLLPGGAGVRAQAMSRDGALLDDFHFVEGEKEIHVVNAPSQGPTASLAIGEEIAPLCWPRGYSVHCLDLCAFIRLPWIVGDVTVIPQL